MITIDNDIVIVIIIILPQYPKTFGYCYVLGINCEINHNLYHLFDACTLDADEFNWMTHKFSIGTVLLLRSLSKSKLVSQSNRMTPILLHPNLEAYRHFQMDHQPFVSINDFENSINKWY